MQTFRSIGLIAVVGMAAASMLAFSADVESAYAASECLAKPNAQPAQGMHWYYHFDRATGRRCWFLHSPLPLVDRPLVHHHVDAASRVRPRREITPKPEESALPIAAVEPAPTSPRVRAPPAPHITILAVKPVETPAVATAPTRPSDTGPAAAEPQQLILHAVQRIHPDAHHSPAKSADSMPLIFALGIGGVLLAVIAVGAAMPRQPTIFIEPDTTPSGERPPQEMPDREHIDAEDVFADARWHQNSPRRRQHGHGGYASPVRTSRAPAGNARNAAPALEQAANVRPRNGYRRSV